MTFLKGIILHASLVSAEDTRVPNRSLFDANWEAGPCPDMYNFGVKDFDK